MRLNQLFAAGAVLALGASVASAATWYTYDGSTLPDDTSATPQQWTRPWNSGATVSSDGDILTITSGAANYVGYLLGGGSSWNPQTAVGTTVDFNLKVVDTLDEQAAAGVLQIATGDYSWEIGLGTGGLYNLVGTEGAIVTLNDGFHTVRFITNGSDDKLDIYVDGSTTKLVTFTGVSSATNQIFFGDNNGSAHGGTVKYDYITWTNQGAVVPEPASLSLLGLGGLALLARRRARA